MRDWTKAQQQQHGEIVEVSHKLGRLGAEKVLRDINEWPCSYLKFCNIEDRIAEAIRRGAIEVLNMQADGIENWRKNFQERF